MFKHSQWFQRGRSDALKDKAPIFRQVGNRIVPVTDDDMSEDMAEDWDDDMRSDYLAGYDSCNT